MTTRIEHQPALDGLRGIAVVLVLLFHGGVSWMGGGYLGVSIFFTLSGFLITTLLDRERMVTGRLDIGRFLARRARRLLPASSVCLVGVVGLARIGWFDGVSHLRSDVLGALLQVQNWVLLAGGDSYTELLARRAGRPSPLEHYWSLAIEEQFYWVWPLVFGAVVAIARRGRVGVVAGLVVLTAVAVVAAPATAWAFGPDAAYWASPARAAEILVGALLAVVVARRHLPRWLAMLGLPALVALVVASMVLPSDGGPAYRGALPLVAIVSAALIAALQHDGLARRVLATPPLVAVGAISYGLYLYHWPIYVALDETRTDRSGPSLLALRLAVTLAIAAVSYLVVERPIRGATWSPRPTALAAAATVIAVVLASAVVPAGADEQYWTVADNATTPARPDPVDAAALVDVAPAAVLERTAVAAPSRPVRIVVVGDSTAESLGGGMVAWSGAAPHIASTQLLVAPGCGFLRGGEVPTDNGVPFQETCDRILDELLPEVLARDAPDVVMLLTTSRDVEDHVFADDGTIGPLDAAYEERLARDYRAITTRILVESAAAVVWVRPPRADPFWLGGDSEMSDDARHAVVDRVMAEVAAGDPARVHVLDLRTWTERVGLDDDRAARPDGLHWTLEAATDVAARYVGPELVTIALGR